MRPARCQFAIALALTGAVSFSCKEESEQEPLTADPPAETATSAPVVNPEIAEAVAQAAQANTAQAVAGENAPPEDGILTLERADQEARAGEPAKVVLGSAGSDPKVSLGGPEIADARIGQLTASVRTGPQSGMPSVKYRFEISGEPAEEGEGHVVTFEVVETSLADEQLGAIPPDIENAIKTIKGSSLGYRSKDGARVEMIGPKLGKKTNEGVSSLLTSAQDALSTVLISYPKERVGSGGFWLVTARENLSVAEVVGYHLVKVERIEGDRVTLSVSTKRYLVGNEFQGLPAAKFIGSAETDLVVMPGHRLPIEGRTQQSLQALVQSQQGPRPVQFEVRGLFAFPPKQDDAPTAPAAASAKPTSTPSFP